MDHNVLYWIWLSRRPRIGAKGQRQLLRQFGSPDALYAADEETLTRAGLSPAVRKALLDKDLEPARAILDRCRDSGVRVLCLAEPDYPSRLLLQEDAPALLYYRGQLPGEERPVVGLVGARDADEAGQRLAFRLGAEIAACGGSVVTGMARGLSPVVGSEQGGMRPVLIVQNDVGNRHSPTVIAAAITSRLDKTKLPTHIDIIADKVGLARDSVVLLEQIRTIDKRRLGEKMGHLDDEVMSAVNEAISVSFGLGGNGGTV